MENVTKSDRISFEKFKRSFDTVITAKLNEKKQTDLFEKAGCVQMCLGAPAPRARMMACASRGFSNMNEERED